MSEYCHVTLHKIYTILVLEVILYIQLGDDAILTQTVVNGGLSG